MNRLLITISFIFLSSLVQANGYTSHPDPSETRIGRYSTVNPGPTPSQKSLLDTIIHTRFHQRITTVGQALDFLLMRSGYRLMKEDQKNVSLMILYNYPLPEVHRDIGPIKLRDALQTLAGPAYRMVIDPLSRVITFDVKPGYNEYLRKNQMYRDSITVKRQRDIQHEKRFRQLESKKVIPHQTMKPHNPFEPNTFQAMKPAKIYGPVQPGENVYDIAKHFALKYQVSVTRMAYAIYKRNHQSFVRVNNRPNINRLRINSVLEIPSYEEVIATNEEEAWDVARRS